LKPGQISGFNFCVLNKLNRYIHIMSKKWILVLVIAGIIIAFRITLPFFIKNYVNNTLQEMEGYSGSVGDIDLALIRGAYVIKDIEIFSERDTLPVPFISVSRIDLSIHWSALFRGSIVGEVVMEYPVVNFAVDGDMKQDGTETDWLEMVKDMLPVRINRFEIRNGVISYMDFGADPEVDVYIEEFDLVITNLTNIENNNERLPSTIRGYGTTNGGGTVDIDAQMNALKEIPDLDLTLTIEHLDMTALNDFVLAYTRTEVEEGTFNLYSEIVIDDGQLKGYVRPVLENLRILDWQDEDKGFLEKVWEAIVEGVKTIFENPDEEQVATQIPIEGNLNQMNVDVGIWPTIWELFRNAFVEALSKRTENIIDFPLQDNK
jgi:hypothetical protein